MESSNPPSSAAPSRDAYGRRPTSSSRGKTHDRIMALQRADDVLPGAEAVLHEAPHGSIGAAISAFHAAVVVPLKVTPRRAYERTLVLLVRDLAERTPTPTSPLADLSSDALAEHLRWRASHGLVDGAEMIRAALHLSRLAAWMDEHEGTSINLPSEGLRAIAVELTESGAAPSS